MFLKAFLESSLPPSHFSNVPLTCSDSFSSLAASVNFDLRLVNSPKSLIFARLKVFINSRMFLSCPYLIHNEADYNTNGTYADFRRYTNTQPVNNQRVRVLRDDDNPLRGHAH